MIEESSGRMNSGKSYIFEYTVTENTMVQHQVFKLVIEEPDVFEPVIGQYTRKRFLCNCPIGIRNGLGIVFLFLKFSNILWKPY